MYFELTDHFIVAADLAGAWRFFGSAENLPQITPPWLSFQIAMPQLVAIGQDSVLDYTIRWSGLKVKWRTKIIDWSPPRQFIDLQVRGPYALWHHQHTFGEHERGTECRDRVIYGLPLGLLGRMVHALRVREQLIEIFRFRRRIIGDWLGWVEALQPDVRVQRL